MGYETKNLFAPKVKSGKSEYHLELENNVPEKYLHLVREETLKYIDKTEKKITGPLNVLRSCICTGNIDFCRSGSRGCISGINPYLTDAQEIYSGKIFKKIDKPDFFDRLEVKIEKQEKILNTLGLSPKIRHTYDFDEELKKEILENTIERVNAYRDKRNYSKYKGYSHVWDYLKNPLGLMDPANKCMYCYSGYNNSRQSDLWIYDENIDYEQFKKNMADAKDKISLLDDSLGERHFIRFGKHTECADIFKLHLLYRALLFGKELGISFHLPTKYLPFDKTIAELLKETGSVLGYSFSYEKLEKGSHYFGCDNKYRLDNALMYANAGVRVLLKMALDVTDSFDECEKFGGNIMQYRKFLNDAKDIAKKNPNFFLEGQIIPLRIPNSKVAPLVTGESFHSLQKGGSFFRNHNTDIRRYRKSTSNMLIPDYWHSDWDEFKRRCGDTGCNFDCDRCGMENMSHIYLSLIHI